MREYFKLSLSDCSFWQKTYLSGKAFYTNKEYKCQNGYLRNIYLVKVDNGYYEVTTGKKFIDIDECGKLHVHPYGVFADLEKISNADLIDVRVGLLRIKMHDLSDKYNDILNEIFVYSPACQKKKDNKKVKRHFTIKRLLKKDN